jgi:hypothetical protein
MIPKLVHDQYAASLPHLNKTLAQGLAVSHVPLSESYIDAVMRAASKAFPPDFRYVDCERLTPQQEFDEISRPRPSKRSFDVARSDIRMVCFIFQFKDEPPIRKYLWLPYVNQAGIIYLAGTRYVISPILADRVISVLHSSVFIRLLKAKLIFNRNAHTFLVNGKSETVQVVHCKIHNKKQTYSRPIVRADHTSVHYLLCKYGFSGMFQKFLGYTPVVGTNDITAERYPPSEWVICESHPHKPRGLKTVSAPNYVPCAVRIAVPRTEYYKNSSTRNLLAGFFYVAGHFPTRVRPEDVDNTNLWMTLLGHVIWPGNLKEHMLLDDIIEHINSLDGYLDHITTTKMRELGYNFNDLYELLYFIIENFNEWSLTSDDRVSTMYDKELSILQFMFVEFIKAINTLTYNLNSAKKKVLNPSLIQDRLNTHLRQGLVYTLTKSSGVCSAQSTSGDNMALKFTNILVPQTSSNRPQTGKSRTDIKDTAKSLHASIAEVGNYSALPKAAPDGRARMNLCMLIKNDSEAALVLRNEKFAPLLDEIQRMIRASHATREFKWEEFDSTES